MNEQKMYIAKCVTIALCDKKNDVFYVNDTYYLYKNGRIATYCDRKQAYKTKQGATKSMQQWENELLETGHAEQIANDVILEHKKYINTFSIIEV